MINFYSPQKGNDYEMISGHPEKMVPENLFVIFRWDLICFALQKVFDVVLFMLLRPTYMTNTRGGMDRKKIQCNICQNKIFLRCLGQWR